MEQNNKQTMPCFELGNLYVFNEEDEDGNVTVIGELIGKYESEDTLTFGNQYEIENEKFVTDQAFDLRISVHEELREATEDEIELFEKHYSIWENGAKEQPDFKPFDKVLVRNLDEHKWRLAMKRVDIKLVRDFVGLHHLSVGNRDIWLTDDEIKALECILKDYNADPNNFKRS